MRVVNTQLRILKETLWLKVNDKHVSNRKDVLRAFHSNRNPSTNTEGYTATQLEVSLASPSRPYDAFFDPCYLRTPAEASNYRRARREDDRITLAAPVSLLSLEGDVTLI